MPVDPVEVAAIALIDSPSINKPVSQPTLVVNGGTLGLIAAGGTTPSPIGGGGGITALTNDVTASGTGSVPATIAAGAVTGTKIALPLVLSDSTAGINRILTLTVPVAGTGDPALSFKAGAGGTTETAYIRASVSDSGLMLVPGTGGFGACWTPGETARRFAWSATGISFFAGVTAAQQAVGVALTNGASGGTASTVSTFAGSVYATDAPIILGNLNQLAIKVNALDAALKAYSLVTN